MIEKIYNWLLRAASKPNERGEYSAGFWQAKIRSNALQLSSHYKGRLLEVGCGEGLFLSALGKVNLNLMLWGVDVDKRNLARAKEIFLREGNEAITLIEADANNLPFDTGYFDAAVCINVFLNMKDLTQVKAALSQMARVCRPGGRIIVEFRNSLNIFVRLKFKLAYFYDSSIRTRHLPLNTYNEKNILSFLKELNFIVLCKKYVGFPWNSFAPIVILEAQKI